MIDFLMKIFRILFGIKEKSEIEEYEEKEEEIKQLNINEQLLPRGSQNRRGDAMRELRAIAIHWVANPGTTPTANRRWFESAQAFGSYQYLIGIDGEIMRVVPENEVAWHVGSSQNDPKSGKIYTDFARRLYGEDVCRNRTNNWHAIGIGLCHSAWDGLFTPATMDSLEKLVVDILTRNNRTVEILTTHWETVGWKRCPLRWCDIPQEFINFRRKINTMMPRNLQVPMSSIVQNY